MDRPPGLRRTGLIAIGAVAVLMANPIVAQASSADVVIGEVYGGGGNTGAPYANDFVELYNHGSAAVSVSGWSVQYASSSGTTWLVTALSGSIQPGHYYLVKLASGGSTGAALPTPDATGTTNMSATAGKVALVTNSTALSCGSACHAAAGVRDFLGYGGANDFEGSAGPAGSNTVSVTRTNPATDTDNNATNFATAAPTPQNSTSGGDTCGYPTPRIRDIQGAAHLSPLNGQAVSNVHGVVTAKDAHGFWFQDPCPDANPATSEGVYVFTNTAPTVSAGNEVSVNATVQEFRSGGATSTNLTVTELATPTVTVLGTKAVPAATVVGAGGRVPPTTVIEDDASGDVETSGTFDPAGDGIDFYESLEGMRVQVNNPVAVGPYNSFGEIPVLADNGTGASVRTNRGGILLRSNDANPERIFLDDSVLAASTPAGTNVGDHFSAAAVGVLSYAASNYKLALTAALTRVSGGLAKETTTGPAANQVSVATFNVENLAPSDPQAKFDGLGAAIKTNLASPDIVAVEEIQDNSGATDDGTVDATTTWTKLISAISAAGGPAYSFRSINPVNDQDGGQPGGNIRVGFLYRTDRGLTFASGTAGGSTTAVSLSSSGNPNDRVTPSVNPGRIAPTNSAWNASRKPLLGKFYFNGKPLFVIANHFNSKGGDDPLYGHPQPPQQPSRTQRGQQATLVANFVDSIQAIDPNARIVVAGDLNDFEYSPPVQTLIASGLTDLPATLSDGERYTYEFEGNAQVLDHILLAAPLVSAGYGYDVVHINSEFATQLSDHDPQVAKLTIS